MEIYGLSFLQVFGRATPAIWCVLPSILGVALYLLLKRGKNPAARLVSSVPLLVGVVLGVMSWAKVNDFAYLDYNQLGPTSVLLMRATLILPILTAIALFVMDVKKFKNIDQTL